MTPIKAAGHDYRLQDNSSHLKSFTSSSSNNQCVKTTHEDDFLLHIISYRLSAANKKELKLQFYVLQALMNVGS